MPRRWSFQGAIEQNGIHRSAWNARLRYVDFLKGWRRHVLDLRLADSINSPELSPPARSTVCFMDTYCWIQPVCRLTVPRLSCRSTPVRRPLLGFTMQNPGLARDRASGRSRRFYHCVRDLPLRHGSPSSLSLVARAKRALVLSIVELISLFSCLGE